MISATGKGLDDRDQFVDHEFVADYRGHLLALLIVLQRLAVHAHVLFLGSHIIKDNHLHVQSVVSLLDEPFFVAGVFGFFDLAD